MMSEEYDIPKHWKIKKLGELCDLQNGVAFKSSNYIEKSNTLIFRMSQIRPGGILDLNHNSKYLPDEFIELYKNYLLKDSDIVIAMTDMASETKILGVPTYFKSDGRNFLLNQRVGKLFNLQFEQINDKFLRYALTSPNVNRYYKSFGKGALQINLGKNDILNVTVPIPPLEEQQTIVSKIEELLSDLENGKQQLQIAQQQLKIYRQSLLKWAFEGKLTNKGLKDGALPKGWRKMILGEVGKVQLGRQRSPKHISKDYPTKYIRAANITDAGLDLSDLLEMEFTPKEFEQYQLLYGDLVLSEASGSPKHVGKPAMWRNKIENCCFQNTIIRLRPKEIALSTFLLWLFKYYYHTGFFANISGGVGINHLSAGKFSNIEISLPSLAEQQLIVDELESKLTVCDKIEETISQSLLQAESLRQSILKKAFEGKLV